MYIIPYFLEIEVKNLLKIKLSKIITEVTNELIDNLFNISSSNKYQKIMLNLDNKIKETVINILKETIEIFDNLYLNCLERKKLFNVCIAKCHRSIFTIFGLLEFDRVYYYDKFDRSKHFFFIDTLFHLPAYDRYDVIVKGITIDNAIATNQNKGAEISNKMLNSISSIINNNKKCNISRQDIYLWINKWNIPEVEYEPIESDSDTLYIMVDEKYIHEQLKQTIDKENTTKVETKNCNDITADILNFINQLNNYSTRLLQLPAPKEKKKNYIMSKAFVTFTGIKEKNQRRTLLNKIIFLTASSNPWTEFMDFIPKIYDFSKYKTIKVLSDAGIWIVNGISNLKLYSDNDIVHCLCEFHVKQKINRITADENLRKLLKEAIIKNNKKDFIKMVNEIKTGKDPTRKKTIEGYKNYIIKYWKAFKNMKASDIGSSMESHICHNVAKFFTFEPKAFSKRRIQKLLKLQEYKANGISILNLYLKTSKNKEKITIKKEEISFNIFENFSSNMPLLYSNDSLTRVALKGLSC